MSLKELIPMLETSNMKETISFYEEVLGFRCINQVKNDWARLERDDIVLMFSVRFTEDDHPNTFITGGLYIYTDTVDLMWAELKDKVKICYPLETFEYGMREFAIYDCNDYLLQFGQDLSENLN
ncbi:MAG: bleomycin resistance family protein [Flavobacteriaceae bacterium]|nr:VOC family protein [Bacteroidia bacterium]MBT8287784.1 VOC family protein [Bacteroidia bacterium]NNF75422.1 bleomycin resistance family protein [Flavobacteriaceae bacterium]NNK72834.1 bleomycin resistance family protein [Flavobacteriaceae bacterium]